jgi:hypothetical protein
MSLHQHPDLFSPSGRTRRCRLLALASLHAVFLGAASADTVAYWNFNSLSIGTAAVPGVGGVPSTIAADIGTGSLSLAAWTGTIDDFGGSTLNAQASAPAEESLSPIAGGTTAPFPGNGGIIDLSVNFAGVQDPIITLDTRGTASGFSSGTWSYSIAGGPFVPVVGANTATTSTSFSTKSVDLSSYNDLDGATSVILRYTLSGATSNTGNNRIDNLLVSATSTGPDTTPPAPVAFSPLDNATNVVADSVSQLTVTFSEEIVLGTGNIVVRKVSDDSAVNTIDVSDFGQVDLNVSILGLPLVNPLLPATAYYVVIPGTAIKDLATSPNTFAGFGRNDNGTPGDPLDDTFVWNFTTTPPPAPPTVVVNKYSNGSPDTIELLVINTGTGGPPLDMRGMIVKDFSADMGSDGGGKFEFTTNALWDSIPVGTQIVLQNSLVSSDVDDSDFVIRVGLGDTTYFTSLGGSFDISATDMVMVKAAGSGASGTTGGIHVLAGGTAGSLFTGFTNARLRAATGGAGVIATNPTSALADFLSGTNATGAVTLTPSSFGLPNTGTNAGYIAVLRGINPANGDGVVVTTNGTPASPYLNTTIFPAGATNQTVKLTVTAQIPSVTLSDITVQVPAALGAVTSETVSLSGTGATGASFTAIGQTISISSASVTTTAPLVITITEMVSPPQSGASATGNYPFAVSTTGGGGALTPVGVQPVARVIIPMEAVRDTDVNGVALDAGTIVALEGVCTMGNFSATNNQAYFQDASAGINLFSPTLLTTPLVRGTRYAVVGTIVQFNGLTEIVPLAESQIFNLGADTAPTANLLTIPSLLGAAEATEGSLVKIENLYKVSGNWLVGQNVLLRDSLNNQVTVRIQPNSTAVTEPTYPLTLTGVLTQSDSSSPFTTGYQILPRDPSDLAAGTITDFESWVSATGATGGMTGDTDFDGRDNAFEYAFGLSPTSGGSVTPFTSILNKTTGEFTFTRRKPSLTGLAYTYQYHTSLTGAWTAFTPAVTPTTNGGDPVEAVTVTVPAVLLTGPKLFIRIVTP